MDFFFLEIHWTLIILTELYFILHSDISGKWYQYISCADKVIVLTFGFLEIHDTLLEWSLCMETLVFLVVRPGGRAFFFWCGTWKVQWYRIEAARRRMDFPKWVESLSGDITFDICLDFQLYYIYFQGHYYIWIWKLTLHNGRQEGVFCILVLSGKWYQYISCAHKVFAIT